MVFEKIYPKQELEKYIVYYWVIQSDDKIPLQQKIIPDGFPEIIFHFGDIYKININKKWEVQKKVLLAGQIRHYFFLENTGRAGVLGIKFKPQALSQIFGLLMHLYADKVVPIAKIKNKALSSFEKHIDFSAGYSNMIIAAEEFLQKVLPGEINIEPVINKALDLIFKSNGTIAIAEICSSLFITERQLQRIFKQYVGLSPKFYSRIIRFNYIFQLIKEGKTQWIDITYYSGYFDQSHFIRDFKSFTGEDPSAYFFDEPNMANFFLRKN